MKDERITQLEDERASTLNNINNAYNGLLADNQNLLSQQQSYANQQLQTQNDILDKQLEYNNGLIQQQKDTAKENLTNEQLKAENDYRKFVNPYGANAEKQADVGLLNSGYAETTQLGAFNVWQNRNANAKASYDKAIVSYDNDMNQARLTNDTQKAQNALTKLKLDLDNIASYYSNKSSLTLNRLNTEQSVGSDYFNRVQNVYNQILNERQQEEATRQYNEKMAYQRERDKVADAQWQKEYDLQKKNLSSSRSSSRSSSSSKKSSSNTSNNATGISLPGGNTSNTTTNTKSNTISTKTNVTSGFTSGSGRHDNYVQSDRTPVFTSKNASKWFSKLNTKMSEESLLKEVDSAVSKGTITEKEAQKVLYAYGYR